MAKTHPKERGVCVKVGKSAARRSDVVNHERGRALRNKADMVRKALVQQGTRAGMLEHSTTRDAVPFDMAI